MEFPLEFKCHNCGSDERIVCSVKEEEVAKGKFNPNIPVAMEQRIIAVFDPTKPTLTCPVLLILRDVCRKCGTDYIYRVERKEGQPQLVSGPQAGQKGMPPQFLKG